ncbi:MAG TPA: SDR family oxidoreductase [Thermoanaerobaculia bacterium]
MEIKQKMVIITGASSGIGRATALEFARRGANVVLAARRAAELENVAVQCRSLGVDARVIPADVTKREDCFALIARAGEVDVLVNNAGFGIFDPIETAKPEDAEQMMATNYFGALHCTQAVLPQMLERRSGSIVFNSSIAGLMGYTNMGTYGATKFAITGFAEALRDEVIRRGVQVALVCPGTTETNFFMKAERKKLPGASRLIPGIRPESVARALCDAAIDGRYRRILPFNAMLFVRLKEFFPRFAHSMFRRVSFMMERR